MFKEKVLEIYKDLDAAIKAGNSSQLDRNLLSQVAKWLGANGMQKQMGRSRAENNNRSNEPTINPKIEGKESVYKLDRIDPQTAKENYAKLSGEEKKELNGVEEEEPEGDVLATGDVTPKTVGEKTTRKKTTRKTKK